MRKILILGGAAAFVAAAFVAFTVLRGGHGCREGDDGHDHGTHGTHRAHGGDPGGKEDPRGGGAHGERAELSLEEIGAARCEHAVLTYECAECRYEIGVVKVPEHLFLDKTGEGPGLLTRQVVEKRRLAVTVNITGEVRLNDNALVHVRPRIPGIVKSVPVDIGTRLEKGAILFSIDSVELGRARNDYERGLALTALARRNLDREKILFERKIASEQDLIESQMAYEQYRTDLAAAEQTLHVLGLTEEDIAEQKGPAHGAGTRHLNIRAPISGTVIERHATAGELVGPDGDVMLLADLQTLWVWGDVYEQDLAQVLTAREKGAIPVEVAVGAFPGRVFKGEIDYVGATMQEQTRTVRVRAVVRNPDTALRPGMFCTIRAVLGQGEETVVIPRDALLSDEGADFVFVHWKGDYYVRRGVKRGRAFPTEVEIADGLKTGETIVNAGAFLLKSDILREKMGAGCAD